MEAAVAAYNASHGLEAERALALTRAKKLRLPGNVVRPFFEAVLQPTVEHITRLVADVGRVDVMVVVGGFAESRLLQQTLRAAFERLGPSGTGTTVLLPKRPSKMVVMGAALFALQPNVVTSRVVRWTYAYLGAEPFNPDLHEPRHAFVTAEGRRLVNILYPLVQKGDSMTVGHEVTKMGLIPVRSDQVVIDFEIFRVDERITDPKAEPRRPRTVIVEARPSAGSFNQCVLRSDKVAMLSVTIGGGDRPRHERTVNLRMKFGTTEITATAESSNTGERQTVAMRYQ